MTITSFQIAYYTTSDGSRNYSVICLGADGRLYKADSPRKPLVEYNMNTISSDDVAYQKTRKQPNGTDTDAPF